MSYSTICAFAKLRATINGLSLEIKKKRSQIKKSNNTETKNILAEINRELGQECRHLHLALAFANNKKYSDLEKSCKIKPRADLIFQIIKNHSFLLWSLDSWKKIQQERPLKTDEECNEFVRNAISSWLKRENSNA